MRKRWKKREWNWREPARHGFGVHSERLAIAAGHLWSLRIFRFIFLGWSVSERTNVVVVCLLSFSFFFILGTQTTFSAVMAIYNNGSKWKSGCKRDTQNGLLRATLLLKPKRDYGYCVNASNTTIFIWIVRTKCCFKVLPNKKKEK